MRLKCKCNAIQNSDQLREVRETVKISNTSKWFLYEKQCVKRNSKQLLITTCLE